MVGAVPADTINDITLVLVITPEIPVMVILYVPEASVLVLFKVTILLLPGTTMAGLKLTVVPAGTPAVAVNATGTT